MASEELRKSRLQRAKDFAGRKPKLPEIAEKADDLQAIKETVDSAATVSGALWLSYLFVMFYIAVAAGAVTHEDLLFQRPVKLPFLNVELPLLAFFFLAPILFVATHVYTIVHFNMLGQKAARFHAELHHQLKDEKDISDKLRRLLPSNVLVQIFAGPPELRDGRFGLILKAIVILTLVVCPILLLLLLQIQFLPHHTGWITWTQRGALIFDVAILWILRPPRLLNGVGGWSFHSIEAGTAPRRVRAMRGAGLALTGVLSLLAIWLSVVVATIPDEWQEKDLAALDPRIWRNPNNVEVWNTPLISTRERLFAGEVDAVTRRRKSLFSNTLVLPGFDIYEALKVDDKTKLDWKDHLIDLRGRALDGAVFWGAKLPKADLTGAQLQGASLNGAQLQGASFVEAQLQGASLGGAQLQGASLERARLQGALLVWAQLKMASLDGAKLQGASLGGAKLQGASLERAQLQGASLGGAQLQGAWLDGAALRGVSLKGAYLWRAHWGELDLPSEKPIWFVNPKWEALNVRFNWQEELWTSGAYQELFEIVDILRGTARDNALNRVRRLLCQTSGDDLGDKTGDVLAPCQANAETPPEVLKWHKLLESAQSDLPTYRQTLLTVLRSLVCTPGADAIHILRGISKGIYPRLEALDREALPLIDDILGGHDCPVSTALTEADKIRLQAIETEVLNEHPPASSHAVAKDASATGASPSAPPVRASAKGDGRP
jgi:uncharacterized protein YjbI with pentapeptide repeats